MSVDQDKAATVRTEITRAIREATGLHERFASEMSEAIVERLRQRWGGDRIYVPEFDRAARDKGVLAAFNGKNHGVICREFGISRATLYRILSNNKKRRV